MGLLLEAIYLRIVVPLVVLGVNNGIVNVRTHGFMN